MSRCTAVRVGLGEPHHLLLRAKSHDCLAMWPVILNGPVPTAVLASLHQVSGFCLTAFSSTIIPVVPDSAIAVSHQPAGPESFTTTVKSSGAVSPVIVTLGSLAASRLSRAAPLFVFADTLS